MKKVITALIALIIICIPQFAYAAFEEPVSESVEIKGRHLVANNEDLITGRHTFILTASDNAPMPKGSEGSIKKVTIDSNQEFSFGKISYSKSGIYEYTVTREHKDIPNLIQDESVYHCAVYVEDDGSAVVVFEKTGTIGKPNKIEYTDRFVTGPDKKEGEADKASGKVKTGDRQLLPAYLLIFIVSMLLIVFVAIEKRKEGSVKK